MGFDSSGQMYLFSILAALAIVFNLLLLLLVAFKIRINADYTYMRASLILQCLCYTVTGLGWLLSLLYYDLNTIRIMCQLGGFFIVLGCQTSLWMHATTSTGLALWLKGRLPEDLRKQSMRLFALIVGGEMVILLPISILPFTNLLHHSDPNDYHHGCTPLRLPGQQGWALSALIIILSWIALIITILSLILAFLRFKHSNQSTDKDAPVVTNPERPLQTTVLVSECISCFGWIVVLLTVSISFSGAGSLNALHWILGLGLTMAITITPIVSATWHGFISRRKCSLDSVCPKPKYALPNAPAPEEIVLVTEWMHESAESELCHAECRWAGPDGRHVSGHMRAWIGGEDALGAYDNERYISALLRQHPPHENVAQYKWSSQEPQLLSAMGLGEQDPRRTSMLCHEEFPLGTLKDFVQQEDLRTSPEVIKAIASDLLRALQHLHTHRVVYNNCSTSSIYIRTEDKGRVQVVLAGFERSFQVSSMYDKDRDECMRYMLEHVLQGDRPPDLLTVTSYLNSSQSLAKNRYSADARALGLILLDVLVMAAGPENISAEAAMKVTSEELTLQDERRLEVNSKDSFLSTGKNIKSSPKDIDFDHEAVVDLDHILENQPKQKSSQGSAKARVSNIGQPMEGNAGNEVNKNLHDASVSCSLNDLTNDLADASSVHTDYTLSEDSMSDTRRWTPLSRTSPWPRYKAILTNGSLMSTPRSTPDAFAMQPLSLPPDHNDEGGANTASEGSGSSPNDLASETVSKSPKSTSPCNRPLPDLPGPTLTDVSTSTDDLTVSDNTNSIRGDDDCTSVVLSDTYVTSVNDGGACLSASAMPLDRPFTDYDCPPPRPPKLTLSAPTVYHKGFPTILEDESATVPPPLYPRRSRKNPAPRNRLSLASMTSSMASMESGDSGLGSDVYRSRIHPDNASMFSTPSLDEVSHTSYEMLPELPERPRKEKMPCIAPHEGHGCCTGGNLHPQDDDPNAIYWMSQRPAQARSSSASSSSSSSYPDIPPYPSLINPPFPTDEERILSVMKKFMPVLLSRAELPTTGPRSTNV